MKSISCQELHHKICSGDPVRLVDVRTPGEFAGAHVKCAAPRPLSTFDPGAIASEAGGKSAELYVMCQSGTRARSAIAQLEKSGFPGCMLVEGGMAAWVSAGLPVERAETSVISLERQVRIAAGLLVLCGTVAAAFLHPAFLVIPGFVGAGLMFAGITDKCGMAMLLARMPWNQVPEGAAANCCSQANL